MKAADAKDNIYIDFSKKVNDKDSKFKVGDHVRISKYKKKILLKNILEIDQKKFL